MQYIIDPCVSLCTAPVLPQVDRLYGWKTSPDLPIRDAFKLQKDHVNTEFEQRSSQVFLQLNEQVRARRVRGGEGRYPEGR